MSIDFLSFASAHGLIIDNLVEGEWQRVRTTDHPKKKNGTYRYLGHIGWVQNQATMPEVAEWRPEHQMRSFSPAERLAFARKKAAEREAEARAREARYAQASEEAQRIIAECYSDTHSYFVAKGFPNTTGLVHPTGDLIIVMRDFNDYSVINSVQRISPTGSKLFLTGGKAGGSVFRMGKGGRERWLCEGFATGLSMFMALQDLRRSGEVVVCFSAGNLKTIASLVQRPAFVMADNDASGTGQEAAEATGLPWVMPPDRGDDANDLMVRKGLRAVVDLMRSATQLRVIHGSAA